MANSTVTYNGNTYNAPFAGIQKQAIGAEDGITYSINAKAGKNVRFTFIVGSWCSPYTINVKNESGTIVASTSVADAGAANLAQVSVDVNATASGTLIVEFVAPSTGNVWLCAAGAATIV